MNGNNQPFLTVGALSKYISQKFDRDPHLRKVRVVGEISNYRHRPNQNQFFALKEGNVVINAIMFRNDFSRLKFQLEEGMKVYITARIGTYEAAGRYQLYVEDVEPDGIGALYLALEQLKNKMKEQGLFDLPKKQLSSFPKRIAVITSPTGAVIRDIITTINRRFPIVEIIVFPTRVQGKEAVGEIIHAFKQVEAYPDLIDSVILARGGGSIEDLWSFNDEKVAHAILNCSYPVISSIGHETDHTIADMVADLRAPTPTAAAEMSVPVLRDLLLDIQQKKQRMFLALENQLNYLRQRLERSSQSYVIQEPARLYQSYVQNLQILSERLKQSQQRYFEKENYNLKHLRQGLLNYQPHQQINYQKEQVKFLSHQLTNVFNQLLQNKNYQFQKTTYLLEAYSPLKVMARGYAIVNKEDEIIRTVDQINKEDSLKVQLIDGLLDVKVNDIVKEDLELTFKNENNFTKE